MTDTMLAWLRGLIKANKTQLFYKTKEWQRVRTAVLSLDKNECQMCKAQGRYTRADTVHHINELKHKPDLGLSVWNENKRNLIAVCATCHEIAHKHRHKYTEPLTKEQW